MSEHVDVLIVGAGLSGIGAGHQLRARFPRKTYTILESREELGGTWSLFTYPGVRSDSDMHTLGYRFRPWTATQAFAEGPTILDYLKDTARDGDVERHIRFGQRAVRAHWSSAAAVWKVEAESVGTAEISRLTCDFLFMCSGYFRYDEGFTPAFDGIERFAGPVVHPQHWPADLDYADKRIVVIGSGATAVTLVPAMAATAAHVTMLQRSPSYIVSLAGKDRLAARLRRVLPERRVYSVIRWKNVLRTLASFLISRRRPEIMKSLIRKGLEQQLPADFDIDTHFSPAYNPWDQRLCVAPDGDLFRALRRGAASVVTDRITSVTETGLVLASGATLDADVIVTATGLNLLLFGGIQLSVDGEPVTVPDHMVYKGIMLSDVPNFAFGLGYTNASWTLKIDLTYDYVWRLLAHLDATGASWCVPRLRDRSVREVPIFDFSSGYVQRSIAQFPKAGSKGPWRSRMNYLIDAIVMPRGSVDDGTMEFGRPAAGVPVRS
ncbi:MAG TPA: NAD(P)/FAD-dependent oxidoreductase [Mycobacteriales bacterium]|nr:NAD(P)/FAD-dependent oxidoreductase [Mycobacteriales bacterium]